MENKELYQKSRFGNYRKHTLSNNKVIVETKTDTNTDRYEVNIFDLGTTLHYKKGSKRPKYILLIILSLMLILVVINLVREPGKENGSILFMFSVLAALLAIPLSKRINDDLFLTGGKKNLLFYRDIPDEASVLAFVEAISENRKQILKKTS